MLAKALAVQRLRRWPGVCARRPWPRRIPNDGVAINGTYTAFSDGEWAKTNQSFHDEASVTQTWTITSTARRTKTAPDASPATRAGARTWSI